MYEEYNSTLKEHRGKICSGQIYLLLVLLFSSSLLCIDSLLKPVVVLICDGEGVKDVGRLGLGLEVGALVQDGRGEVVQGGRKSSV